MQPTELTGVVAAHVAGVNALRRSGVTHGSLVLMSDLNDSQDDRDALVAEAQMLRQAHVPVRIVPINASPQNVQIFAQLFAEFDQFGGPAHDLQHLGLGLFRGKGRIDADHPTLASVCGKTHQHAGMG